MAKVSSSDETCYDGQADYGLGSIAHIHKIPRQIRDNFKTAWELGPEAVVDMAIVAAPYICQGQSLSFHLENPCLDRMVSALNAFI